jgi:alanine dehydrogenase
LPVEEHRMDIGVPREVSSDERRVALTPAGAHRLVKAGHRVWVERSAGLSCRMTDEDFTRAGVQVAYDAEEVYQRADLLLKIATPTREEHALLHEGQILMCFLMLAMAPADAIRSLLERKVSAVAMELIEDDRGRAPVLEAVSEIAGAVSIQTAAHLLQSDPGGRGILLGGAPGIAPATVVILGAGGVGAAAARAAIGHGAQVFVLDKDLARLRRIHEMFAPRARTWLAEEYEIGRAAHFADVLVGAVHIRGDRAPHLVSEAMVKSMKPGAVIIDVSIDQGGCIETSRPTTLAQPTFLRHDVVHYCVPNMTSSVARTATYALSNARMPYVLQLADRGLAAACASDDGLRRGLVAGHGHCFHPLLADRFGIPCADPSAVLRKTGVADDNR